MVHNIFNNVPNFTAELSLRQLAQVGNNHNNYEYVGKPLITAATCRGCMTYCLRHTSPRRMEECLDSCPCE